MLKRLMCCGLYLPRCPSPWHSTDAQEGRAGGGRGPGKEPLRAWAAGLDNKALRPPISVLRDSFPLPECLGHQ